MSRRLLALAATAVLLGGCPGGPQAPPPVTVAPAAPAQAQAQAQTQTQTQTIKYQVGSTTYTNQADYLAALRRQEDAVVAKVGKSAQRVGGSLLVVLPTLETLTRIGARIQLADGVKLDELFAQQQEINLLTNARAVEQGQAFAAVRTIRAETPEAVGPGDADWVLRYATDNKWSLANAAGAKANLVLPGKTGSRAVWLEGFNVAVLNASAELGASVARQQLPGPAAATSPPSSTAGAPVKGLPPPPPKGPFSGTAFFVDAAGHAVTNAHVVPGCKSVKIALADGKVVEARVAARDVKNDLALLSVSSAPHAHGRLNVALPRQGDSVLVYGYPLAPLLATQGSLTAGMVSALSGPNNDSRVLQISAPVQPGNSGGPLFDSGGAVIGVVFMRMNSALAQNVNFAIKATVVADFLGSNGVTPAVSGAKATLSPADIADLARSFTYKVVCEP
jgi:S1-C subfamily serine protease